MDHRYGSQHSHCYGDVEMCVVQYIINELTLLYTLDLRRLANKPNILLKTRMDFACSALSTICSKSATDTGFGIILHNNRLKVSTAIIISGFVYIYLHNITCNIFHRAHSHWWRAGFARGFHFRQHIKINNPQHNHRSLCGVSKVPLTHPRQSVVVVVGFHLNQSRCSVCVTLGMIPR